MMEGDRSFPGAMNPDILSAFQKAYQNLDLFPLVEPETIEQFRVEYGREVLVRSLAIREAQLGPEHPNTANSLWNLAALRTNQNRYAEAKVLLERALDIFQQKLGNDHPSTTGVQRWLNRVNQALGDGSEREGE